MSENPGCEPAERAAAESPRFIVDVNVGKLAKWLRILGFDTLFINPIDDRVLVDIAFKEGRIVLTKDTGIPKRRVVTSGQVRVLLVEGDRVQDQLRFVVDRLKLCGPFRLLSRCLECNVHLEPVECEQVKDQVPPYVYRTQQRYLRCPCCGRIYWQGTHWQRMRAVAKAILGSSSCR